MDLQVDKMSIFNPQNVSKLRDGERVEVRQKDVGLRGSWHQGTIVGLKAGSRLVEYDELLTDDGLSKLRESIPCPKLNDICSSPKSHTLVVTPTWSPSKRRGLLRPCPPPRTEPSPLTWKGGLFVDVFYEDAWWEAVLLNDVTSLDEGALVDVIFPDEGDLARVHVKDMRISQCWDEVSGDWSIKGSIDLSRFLKRRGIGKKEVSLTADSGCRASEVCNSFTHNEVKLNRKEWAKTCSSLVSISKAPSSCKTVINKSYEELSPPKRHEQLIPIRSSTEESTVQTIMPSRDGSLIFDLPESERHLEIPSSIGKSNNVLCEGPQHPETHHGGPLFGNDTETVDSGQESLNREDVSECKRSSPCQDFEAIGFGRETVEKECIEGSVFFKRRKIGEVPPSSYVSEPKLSDSQSVLPSFLHDDRVETFKLIHEESSSGIGKCSTAYKGAVHSRGLSNLKGPSKPSSAMMLKETEVGLSFGSEDSNLFQKPSSSSPPTGKLDCSNKHKRGSKLLQTRPVCKMYLLALEAPVRKSREEYDQILLAGKAALGDGVNSCRYRGKKVFARELQEEDNGITLAGDETLEGGVFEMITRPKNQAGKSVPVCVQNSRENYGKSITAEKSKLGGVALEKASRSGRKAGAPAQKPSKEGQIILAGKPTLERTANERSVRIRKRAGEILRSVGSTERSDTLRSFRDDLVRQKQAKALKRKASHLSLVLEAGGKVVKLLKGSKSGRELEQSEAATPFSLSNCEDSIAMKRKAHKRIRVLIASNPAEPASTSCFVDCKGSNSVKRKALKESCMLEHGGRSAVKLSRVSKTEGEPDQAEIASASRSSNFKVKKLKKTDDKSLKNLASEIGKKAVLEAGFTLQYRPRRGHLSFDAVYTSPKGHSYWSLPKAWQALGNEKKKGRVKVEKAVIQQVLSKIDQDENLRSAFERLDKFSGTCLEEVLKQANMTYAELTDVLIKDLRVLRKNVWKPKVKKGMVKGKLEKKQSGRKTPITADLKTSLLASGSLPVKKRGRKRKQEVQSVSGKVDCVVSTSKVYSRLKHVQGNSLPKFDKNRSKSMEGTSRTLNRSHTSIGFSKAALKAGTSIVDMSIKKRKNRKGSFKNCGSEDANLKTESSKKKEKELKPRSGLRLEVRPSSSCMDDVSEELSCQSNRTVLSWMIGRGAVLETERISYVDQVSNEVLKEGVVTREGILCRCCKRVYTVKGFEEHGGSQGERPVCNLLFASGKTFLDCQLKAWNVEIHLRRTQNYKGVSANDTNDDTCLLCGDGGVLLCCDFCPSTFHASCLQLDNVPEGNWYCPKCRCGVCKGRYDIEEEAVCSQCEHRYHIDCLQGGQTILQEQFLCRDSCKKIYSGLKNLTGITHPLGKGLSWTLLHCIEEPRTEDFKVVMQNNSKLAVAILVLKECFNPMDDPRTNIDMITHAAYNRRSQFCRLDYVGFYTVVLERDDEIISVASIRVHGARVAEMPLIGTRHKYRRQGMCRLLVGAIEKLLLSLEVTTFILPAIPELYATWTQAFGFRPLDSSLSLEIKDLSMMMFPGTDLLQKSLLGDTAVNSPSSFP